MKDRTVVISVNSVSHLKKKAKLLKRKLGCSHHAALEEVATSRGFRNWHHVTLAAKESAELEKRLNRGLFLLMEVKEGLDEVGEDFEIAPEVMVMRAEEITAWYRSANPDDREVTDAEIFQEANENFLCLRYVGTEKLPVPSKAVDAVAELTFWPPRLIWLRGELIDPETYVLDEDDLEEITAEPMPSVDEGVLRKAFGGGYDLVLNSPNTMEYFKAFVVPRKAWNWCLHCERAYPQGSYRQVRDLQMCPYKGCDGDAVMDLWTWGKVRSVNPGYPQTPELGVQYALYGS